jgi:L-iditol 2-dehydrogenase
MNGRDVVGPSAPGRASPFSQTFWPLEYLTLRVLTDLSGQGAWPCTGDLVTAMAQPHHSSVLDGGIAANATMRASVMTGLRTDELQERPVPTPGADEVLVRIDAVGICGSDTHFYTEGHIADLVVQGPLVLGHECAGTIVAVGSGVPRERIDERVAVEPQRNCGICWYCKSGRYNLCERTEFLGCPPIDGAFVEYLTVRADFAHPVPTSMSAAEAALLEPLSVGICAARKAHVTGGSRVFISGAGPVGLLTAQVAVAFGATTVIVSDVSARRLAVADQLGATRTIDVTQESLDGVVADIFIDCSGNAGAILAGLRTVRPAGRAVLVGMGAEDITIPLALIQHREIELTGVFRYADTWPTAIELAASGRIELQPLLTGTYGLADAGAALVIAETDPASLKAVVEPAR